VRVKLPPWLRGVLGRSRRPETAQALDVVSISATQADPRSTLLDAGIGSGRRAACARVPAVANPSTHSSSEAAERYGAFMEQSGRNRWQPVANGAAAKVAQTGE
jgi:hypothetical protein